MLKLISMRKAKMMHISFILVFIHAYWMITYIHIVWYNLLLNLTKCKVTWVWVIFSFKVKYHDYLFVFDYKFYDDFFISIWFIYLYGVDWVKLWFLSVRVLVSTLHMLFFWCKSCSNVRDKTSTWSSNTRFSFKGDHRDQTTFGSS